MDIRCDIEGGLLSFSGVSGFRTQFGGPRRFICPSLVMDVFAVLRLQNDQFRDASNKMLRQASEQLKMAEKKAALAQEEIILLTTQLHEHSLNTASFAKVKENAELLINAGLLTKEQLEQLLDPALSEKLNDADTDVESEPGAAEQTPPSAAQALPLTSPPKSRKCSYCQLAGHNTRSCPDKKAGKPPVSKSQVSHESIPDAFVDL